MHPIERLRHVARAQGAGPALLVREAAGALAGFGDDPPGLVTACRRLVDRHPDVGPMWWLAAKVLGGGDPVSAARAAAEELEDDTTGAVLARALPVEGTVAVLGWPEIAGGVVLELLSRAQAGLGPAVAEASLLLIEASALGPTGFAAEPGARAAAAVARHAEVPTWVVAGAGRVLPARLWDALVDRLDCASEPWEAPAEVVPLDLADQVVGPDGMQLPSDAVRRADCPVAPELLRLPNEPA